MRATAKTLKTFIKSFGLPAYAVQTIPDDVHMPYLTYPLTEPEWNQKATFYIQGWYRTTDYTAMLEKLDEILASIGQCVKLDSGVGYVVVYPESPLVQFMVDGDARSFYINLSINAYQMPGAYPVTIQPSESSEEGE